MGMQHFVKRLANKLMQKHKLLSEAKITPSAARPQAENCSRE